MRSNPSGSSGWRGEASVGRTSDSQSDRTDNRYGSCRVAEVIRPPSYRSLVRLHRMLPMAAIVGALTPAAALGSFPGGNGVIAYTAERSIWAVDPNTGNGLRLTSGSDDSAPSFSP